MSSRFRHVLFIPDPFVGLRLPLGALVEQDGRVQFVASPMLPCASCVGSATASLARYLADRCSEIRDFDRHPGFSSQMELGGVQELPDGDEITAPVGWVRAFALPQQPLGEPLANSGAGSSFSTSNEGAKPEPAGIDIVAEMRANKGLFSCPNCPHPLDCLATKICTCRTACPHQAKKRGGRR